MPIRIAATTASVFECTPSLVRMFCTCVRSVCGLMPRSAAMPPRGPRRPSTQDLDLARRQPVDAALEFLVGLAPGARGASARFTSSGRCNGSPAVGHADRVGDVGERGGLAQTPAGARLDRARQRDVVALGREDDHGVPRRLLPDAPGGLDAVDVGHPQVHEDHVGCAVGGRADRLLTAVDDLDDREVLFLVERDLQGLAEGAMVVGDDDADLVGAVPPGVHRRIVGRAAPGSV